MEIEELPETPEETRDRMSDEYSQIRVLMTEGVIGQEFCPEPTYWHWPVLKPECLPDKWQDVYRRYGELRW
jgi:hypothetical protein